MSGEKNRVWYDGEGEYYVASSAQAAFDLHCAHVGLDPAGLSDEQLNDAAVSPVADWRALPDERVFTIQNYADDGQAVTKTCAEWAATEKPGPLASENY